MDTGFHLLELSGLSIQETEHVRGQPVDLVGDAGQSLVGVGLGLLHRTVCVLYLIVIILAVFGHFKEIFIIVEKSLPGSWSLLKNLVYALRTIVVLHFGSLFVPDSITVSL